MQISSYQISFCSLRHF